MSDGSKPVWRRQGWAWHAPVAVAFVALASWSWRKWPDILTDFGHQLYVPWRLSLGEVMYRDFYYIMGPVSQYAHGLLFRVFGVSLSTLIWANLALLAAVTAFVIWFWRRVGDRLTAMAAALVFLGIFAFSQYVGVANFTWVCAYRYELPHGLAVCLALIACLDRYGRRRQLAWLGGVGVCLALAGLLKTEIFMAAAGAAGIGIGLLVWRERPAWRRLVLGAACTLGAMVAVVLLWWGYFALKMPAGEALKALFTTWSISLNREAMGQAPFYRVTAGLDQPGDNLWLMLKAAIGMVAFVAAAAGLDRAAGRCGHRRAVYAVTLGIVVLAGGLWLGRGPWFQVGRPLPLVCLAGLAIALVEAWRSGDDDSRFRRALLLACWSVLAGLLLVKMALHVRLDFYGFVLAMPATLLAVWLLLHWLPARLAGWGGSGDLLRAAAGAALVAMLATYLHASNEFYRPKTMAIGRGGDQFWHNPLQSPRHQLLPEFLVYLSQRLPPDASFTVIPQMGVFNYLLRRPDPAPLQTFTPWEMIAYGGEAKVLAAMQAHPPDAIVIMDIDMKEDGRHHFGDLGYGDQIVAWTQQAYTLDQMMHIDGPDGQSLFRIAIFMKPPDGLHPPPELPPSPDPQPPAKE